MAAPDNDKLSGRETTPVAEAMAANLAGDRFRPGEIIDNIYVVERKLGHGGMGQVYLAEHSGLNCLYAVKVLDYSHDEALWQRFTNEARLIAKLNHPNIVKVHNMGVHQGKLPYYAMDLIEGNTLAALLKAEGRQSVENSLKIFIQVCRCLSFAHNLDIVHRDIKPANIMLVSDNRTAANIKVLDFGLAKYTAGMTSQDLTRTGEIFGSPAYMSPEQALGAKIDARTDIYSTAVSLFETLTGVLPFASKNQVETLMKVQQDTAPSLHTASGGLSFPQELERVIALALEKKPQERYQTMDQLACDLEAIAAGQPAEQMRRLRVTQTQSRIKALPSRKKEGKKNQKQLSFSALAAALLAGLLLLALLASIAIVGWRGDWHKATGENGAIPPPGSSTRRTQRSEIDGGENQERKAAYALTPFRSRTRQGRLFIFTDCPSIGDILEISHGTHPVSPDREGRLYLPPGNVAYLNPSDALIAAPDQLQRFGDGDLDGLILDTRVPVTVCLKVACRWPSLKYLEIMDASLSKEDLEIIGGFKNLKELKLNTKLLNTEEVANLPILLNLETLEVSRAKDASPIIEKLSRSRNIRNIILDSTRVDHATIEKITALRGIKSLSLRETGINDKDVKTLTGLPNLYSLFLGSNPDITKESLPNLAAIRTRALKVSHIGWAAADITTLRKLKSYVEADTFR